MENVEFCTKLNRAEIFFLNSTVYLCDFIYIRLVYLHIIFTWKQVNGWLCCWELSGHVPGSGAMFANEIIMCWSPSGNTCCIHLRCICSAGSSGEFYFVGLRHMNLSCCCCCYRACGRKVPKIPKHFVCLSSMLCFTWFGCNKICLYTETKCVDQWTSSCSRLQPAKAEVTKSALRFWWGGFGLQPTLPPELSAISRSYSLSMIGFAFLVLPGKCEFAPGSETGVKGPSLYLDLGSF